jgi:hypothetical protein
MAKVYLIEEELSYSDEFLNREEINKEYLKKLILEGKIIPVNQCDLQ